MSPLANRTIWFVVLLLVFVSIAVTIARQGYQQGYMKSGAIGKPVRLQGRLDYDDASGHHSHSVVIEGVISDLDQ